MLTGVIWLLDKFVLRAKRAAESKEPWWVEYSKSFFPVILGGVRVAFIRGRTVQDPIRFDDPDTACGRFHSGESLHLRLAFAYRQ